MTRTRWNSSNSNLVPYKSPAQPFNIYHSAQAYDSEKELELLDKYPCPQADTFVLSQSTINGRLSEHNYQQWMHTLLYIEEMARFDLIAKFNLTTNLKITNNFILAPNGMATSTAKYSHSGELFGVLVSLMFFYCLAACNDLMSYLLIFYRNFHKIFRKTHHLDI